jgi:hypothetical protein
MEIQSCPSFYSCHDAPFFSSSWTLRFPDIHHIQPANHFEPRFSLLIGGSRLAPDVRWNPTGESFCVHCLSLLPIFVNRKGNRSRSFLRGHSPRVILEIPSLADYSMAQGIECLVQLAVFNLCEIQFQIDCAILDSRRPIYSLPAEPLFCRTHNAVRGPEDTEGRSGHVDLRDQ